MNERTNERTNLILAVAATKLNISPAPVYLSLSLSFFVKACRPVTKTTHGMMVMNGQWTAASQSRQSPPLPIPCLPDDRH